MVDVIKWEKLQAGEVEQADEEEKSQIIQAYDQRNLNRIVHYQKTIVRSIEQYPVYVLI